MIRDVYGIGDVLYEQTHPRPAINSSPVKSGGWKTAFLLGFGNFSGASC